jgi:hypothetical protein
MKALVSSFIVMFLASVVHAQPGTSSPDPSPYPPPPPTTTEPSPYPPPPPAQPQPYPQPQPPTGYAPQPYQPMPIQLSADDHKLLMRGEISDGQHIGGVAGNLFFGFGLGQAIQGRWGDTGWIFTLGEIAAITAVVVGATRNLDCAFDEPSCDEDEGVGLIVAGMVGLVVFRVWSVVDAFAGPQRHNTRVRELRMRLGMPMPMYTRLQPYVAPTRDGGGGIAGVTFRF